MLRLSGTLISFNSTLVQLKDTSQPSDASAKSSFNSTLVQLKVLRVMYISLPGTSFNSTLVQLKVIIRCHTSMLF